MALVALLSNPRSTGNQSLLPRVRAFCAAHDDIFHYEVEHAEQIGAALKTIARVKPKVLVINGGDGNDWGDGGGFSRNPRLSLTSLRPRYQNVAVNVGQGVLGLNVVLNYRFGLSVRPVRG